MISLVLAAAVSWPAQYNAGVTEYHSNDFSSAAAAFEQATAAPDHALQQRAYYNLGNTSYRLGEADPTKAQPLWERAIKNYESALALNPNDEDAKFNRDLVKKKLEELKKQQQQQNQKNKDDKKQDQKNQEQQKDEQQQKQDQPSNQQQSQPEKSEPKQQPEQQPQPAQAGNLDKQQAKALLDNLREEERNWNFFPELQMNDLKDEPGPVKDW